MTFEKFVKEIKAGIELMLDANSDDGYEVIIRQVRKNNGVELTGLTITNDTGIQPTIYLDGFYNRYNNGASLADIEKDILNAIRESELDIPTIDMKKLCNKEFWLNNIYKVIVNKEMNQNSDVYFEDYLDLAVQYRLFIDKGTITLTNDHMEKFGITEQELHDSATGFEYLFIHINDVLAEMGAPIPEEIPTLPMMVITTDDKRFGATAISDIDFLDKVSEDIGSFYIIPSSIHELITIPEEYYNPDLIDIIALINDTEVDKCEILSYSLYKYDAKTKEVKIV